MIPFHSLHVAPKQDYLHSIHFHSFPFLYFKTFNQGYLIPFRSILFHSFPLLKYIPFHSLMIIPFHFIPFPYKLPNKALESINLDFSLSSLSLSFSDSILSACSLTPNTFSILRFGVAMA